MTNTLPDSARAVVQTGVRRLELQHFPLPGIGPDDGLLRMEVCGICSSDYEQYNSKFTAHYPVMSRSGGSQRWVSAPASAGGEPGDLVVVEPGLR